MPRTTKPTGGGKRYPLNMRTTRETRELLKLAASENGRSLAQEVEARLERSFDHDETFGGAEVFGLIYAVASAMKTAGRRAAWAEGHHIATPWINSPYAYDEAMQAAIRVLEALRPAGDVVPPPPRQQPEPRIPGGLSGRSAAEVMLDIYTMPEDARERGRRALGKKLTDRLDKEQDK